MTGADMGFGPMVSPQRHRMARALRMGGDPMPNQGLPGMTTTGLIGGFQAGSLIPGFPELPPGLTQQASAAPPGMAPGTPGPTMARSAGDNTLPADDLSWLSNAEHSGSQHAGSPDDASRSSAKDLRSYDSLSAMLNDPSFQGDWGKVASMASPMTAGLVNLATGEDMIQNGFGGFGGKSGAPTGMPGLALEGTFQDLNTQAANQAQNDIDLDTAAAAGAAADPAAAQEAGGMGPDFGGFAEGGIVMPGDLGGPDPLGPDQGFAALRAGEVVLNKDQQKRLGRDKIARALMGRR